MRKRTRFRILVAVLIAGTLLDFGLSSVFLCAKDTPPSPDQGQKVGELNLQGQHIERLVLRQKDGGTKKFDKPGETIKLPVGEYRLQEVRLQGGYSCGITTGICDADWVTIAEDKPAVLKVGAPLKQAVRVERRGRFLVLNYELLGVGGEKYTQADRNKPPTFTVYKANRQLASGKFQFG